MLAAQTFQLTLPPLPSLLPDFRCWTFPEVPQRSQFLVLTKRSAASGNENANGKERVWTFNNSRYKTCATMRSSPGICFLKGDSRTSLYNEVEEKNETKSNTAFWYWYSCGSPLPQLVIHKLRTKRKCGAEFLE